MSALIWLLSCHPRRYARALATDARRALVRLCLGVRCDLCADYYRGPRTLAAHVYDDHAGDAL